MMHIDDGDDYTVLMQGSMGWKLLLLSAGLTLNILTGAYISFWDTRQSFKISSFSLWGPASNSWLSPVGTCNLSHGSFPSTRGRLFPFCNFLHSNILRWAYWKAWSGSMFFLGDRATWLPKQLPSWRHWYWPHRIRSGRSLKATKFVAKRPVAGSQYYSNYPTTGAGSGQYDYGLQYGETDRSAPLFWNWVKLNWHIRIRKFL